jgi:hypothetical protein
MNRFKDNRYLGGDMKKILITVIASAALGGCTFTPHDSPATTTVMEDASIRTNETYAKGTPGVVDYVWEEPMIDVVDVPPGLDPEGHYYRPAHQSITEVRQGKWRYYRDPGK